MTPLSKLQSDLFTMALKTGVLCGAALAGIIGSSAPTLAATITVDDLGGGAVVNDALCTLREAMESINAGAAQNGCAAVGAFGAGDRINIPAGTITVTGAALPTMTVPVTISGASPIAAGATATVIDYNNGNFGPGFFFAPGAAGSTLQNLTIQNVGTATSVTQGNATNIRVQAPNTTIDNVISQGSLSALNGSQDGSGILFDGNNGSNTAPFGITNPANSILRNSIIRRNAHAGVSLRFGTTGVQVNGNIIEDNGRVNAESDGIEIILGSNNNIIENNQIINNSAYGIDILPNGSNLPSDGNIIRNNLILNNGFGSTSQDAGIGIRFGTNTTITNNVISGNDDDGVVVINGSTGNRITQNNIFNNGTAMAAGQLAIDLGGGNQGDGVTSNDNGDADSVGMANGLFNFPVFEAAIIAGNQLILPGFARPGTTVELFMVTVPDPNNFGESEFFLTTLTEGGGDDGDGGTGAYNNVGGAGISDTRLAYGNAAAGLLGSDNAANRFLFTLNALPTLQTTANLAAVTPALTASPFAPGARNNTPLQIGDVITATGTSAGNGAAVNSTSELSGLVTITAGLGVAKQASAPTPVTGQPGVFDVDFTITIENLSPIVLTNVQITDDLNTTFAGANAFQVQPGISVTATQGTGSAAITTDDTAGTANAAFNGTGNNNLLAASAVLAPVGAGTGGRSFITVEYTVRVTPGTTLQYFNTAVGTANVGNSTVQLTDNSNDGGNILDGGTSDPTIDPNNTPTPISFGLQLIKRITRIVRGGTATNFTNPTDSPPDNTFVGVTTPPAPLNELQSGDLVEYTIYYLNTSGNAFTDVSICDQIPASTSFAPNGFAPGQGIRYDNPGATLNQPGVNQNNTGGGDDGEFLPRLTANGACPGGDAGDRGAAFVNVGTVADGERGFMRFTTTVD